MDRERAIWRMVLSVFSAVLLLGCAKTERDFTVDVFIRTKGGENIKCGLVTVSVFDEAAINSWQPRIVKMLADEASMLENKLVVAKKKRLKVESELEAAEQKYRAASKKLSEALTKTRTEIGGVGAEDIEQFVKKADPAAYEGRATCQKLVDEKKEEKDAVVEEDHEIKEVVFRWEEIVTKLVFTVPAQSLMTAKTDADGRCTGQLSKPGRYAFCADFSRLVGGQAERSTWLIWVRFDEPSTKKIMLSNDNTLFSGSPDNVLQSIPTPKLP